VEEKTGRTTEADLDDQWECKSCETRKARRQAALRPSKGLEMHGIASKAALKAWKEVRGGMVQKGIKDKAT